MDDNAHILEHIKQIMVNSQGIPTEKSLEIFKNEAKQLTEIEYKVISFCQEPRKRKEKHILNRS